MGKGNRNRKQRGTENKHAQRARDDAKRLDRIALIVCIFAIIALVITIGMQIWSQALMYMNLHNGVYEAKGNAAEDIQTLSTILPSGTIGVVLVTLGVIATVVLVRCRMPKLALIGFGAAVAGLAFFIVFAHFIGILFPYVALDSEIGGRGMTFMKMLFRHYSTVLPVVLTIPAIVLGILANRKREIADVMESAMSGESTLSLGDE